MYHSGKVIACVGSPGSGKSTFIRNSIKNVNPDTLATAELRTFGEYPQAALQTNSFPELITIGRNTRNKTLIFEDCTEFFYRCDGAEMKRMIGLITTTKGHLNHDIFLSFHSLSTIPPKMIIGITHVYYTRSSETGVIPKPYDRINKNYTLYPESFFYLNL